MEIYRIEGFGIPGDQAYVEAESERVAKLQLRLELHEKGIDYHPMSRWVVTKVERPMQVLIFWRN